MQSSCLREAVLPEDGLEGTQEGRGHQAQYGRCHFFLRINRKRGRALFLTSEALPQGLLACMQWGLSLTPPESPGAASCHRVTRKCHRHLRSPWNSGGGAGKESVVLSPAGHRGGGHPQPKLHSPGGADQTRHLVPERQAARGPQAWSSARGVLTGGLPPRLRRVGARAPEAHGAASWPGRGGLPTSPALPGPPPRVEGARVRALSHPPLRPAGTVQTRGLHVDVTSATNDVELWV